MSTVGRLGDSFGEWKGTQLIKTSQNDIQLSFEGKRVCNHNVEEKQLLRYLKTQWKSNQPICNECFIEAKKRSRGSGKEEEPEEKKKKSSHKITPESSIPIPLSPTVWWMYLYVHAGTPDFEESKRLKVNPVRKEQFPKFSIEDAKNFIKTGENKRVEKCWKEIFPVLFSDPYLDHFIETTKQEELEEMIRKGYIEEDEEVDVKHNKENLHDWYVHIAKQALDYERKWFNLEHWPFYHGKDAIFDILDETITLISDQRLKKLKETPYIVLNENDMVNAADGINEAIFHVYFDKIEETIKESLKSGNSNDFFSQMTKKITQITDPNSEGMPEDWKIRLHKGLENLYKFIFNNKKLDAAIEECMTYKEEGFYPPCTTSWSEIAFTTARERAENLGIKKGGTVNDNHYNNRLLSCNNSIFGNWSRKGECTLYYIILSRNIHDPSIMLRRLDLLNEKEEEAFDTAKHAALREIPKAGRMDMHFIPWKTIDKFAYLSWSYGIPIEDNRNFTVVLEDLWKQTLEAKSEQDFFDILQKLHTWQSRLVDTCYAKFGKIQGIQREIIHSDLNSDNFVDLFKEVLNELEE